MQRVPEARSRPLGGPEGVRPRRLRRRPDVFVTSPLKTPDGSVDFVTTRVLFPRTPPSRASRGGHSLPGPPRDARDAPRTAAMAADRGRPAAPPVATMESVTYAK